MYLEGIITIDPSQITEIKKVKPTKAFKKFLHHLTLGGVSDKEERETFTAVAILQQLNATFRSLGINNIIKLTIFEMNTVLRNIYNKGNRKTKYSRNYG